MNTRILTSLIPACLTLALALALAPTPAAGEEADDRPQEDFRALETRLLQALADGDTEAAGQLISPQFGYYQMFDDRPMEGLGAAQWQQEILGSQRLESFEIHESHARPIGEEVMMTATRATLVRAGEGSGKSRRLLTSTWLKDAAGAWKLVARIDAELGAGGGDPRRGQSRARRTEREAWRAGMSDEDREALREALRTRASEEDREALRERWGDAQSREELREALRRWSEARTPSEPAGEGEGEEPPPDGD